MNNFPEYKTVLVSLVVFQHDGDHHPFLGKSWTWQKELLFLMLGSGWGQRRAGSVAPHSPPCRTHSSSQKACGQRKITDFLSASFLFPPVFQGLSRIPSRVEFPNSRFMNSFRGLINSGNFMQKAKWWKNMCICAFEGTYFIILIWLSNQFIMKKSNYTVSQHLSFSPDSAIDYCVIVV